jgi:hypothetical protein
MRNNRTFQVIDQLSFSEMATFRLLGTTRGDHLRAGGGWPALKGVQKVYLQGAKTRVA